MKNSFSVVTTFHREGLQQYAQRMIDTFCENWPSEVHLYLYPEQCMPQIPPRPNLTYTPLESVREWCDFKRIWQHEPRANGDISRDPVRSLRRDSEKRFKWDAIRFCHKVYAIFDCARQAKTEWLLWMDADMVCHSRITVADLSRLCPVNVDLCYLGRGKKFSECGLYAMKLTSPNTREFLDLFQMFYDDAENGIFTLDEWHDSFVFDAVRKICVNLRQHDWSANLGDIRPTANNSAGEGHPLINSAWGAYLDHLKGDRKTHGRSLAKDIKVSREEPYWKTHA